MNTTTTTTATTTAQPLSLSQRYEQAIQWVESSPVDAIDHLQRLQVELAHGNVLSNNDLADELPTFTIPFIALEHHLAMAHINLPMTADNMDQRQQNLIRACDLWAFFVQRMERLDLLNSSKEDQKYYQDLMEVTSNFSESNSSNDQQQQEEMKLLLPPPPSRTAKIARFQAKKEAMDDANRLQSLLQRRHRLGLLDHMDEMDGHSDEDSLLRSIAFKRLQVSLVEALDEWASALRELPMIRHMVQSQQERQGQQSRYSKTNNNTAATSTTASGPMKVTHITQDKTTGQLQIRHEELRSQVFSPGWNQPTMSLEELADREVAAALDREKRQAAAEAAQVNAARRYEFLHKDGLEDNADLVDASAVLDRQWDDFKDANPRGSGNKRGDVGDRNF